MKKTLPILLTILALGGCAKKAAFHAQYDALIREAKTPTDKQTYAFEYRLLCYAEKNELEQHFVVADGIDQFEAWMLVKAYVDENVGICSGIDLPKKDGSRWLVRSWVGREAKGGPSMYVDTASGRLTCAGHPSVEDPTDFLARYYGRFKKT